MTPAKYRVSLPSNRICIPEAGLALVAIPKVANTAIKLAVLQAYGVSIPSFDPGCSLSRSRLEGHPLLKKCTAQEARSRGFRVVAIVRHPLDRLVSVWADKICRTAVGSANFRERGCSSGMDFAKFVRALSQLRDHDLHTVRQIDFVYPRGKALTDEILRFEDLPEAWDRVRSHWPKLRDLPRANASIHADWQSYYSDEIKCLATELYLADLKLANTEYVV